MKESISFFVAGIPKPAGSKRGFALKKGGQYTGRVVITDDNKKSKDWKGDCKHAATQVYSGGLWNCPIQVRLEFLLPRPKHHFGTGKNKEVLKLTSPFYHTIKPDCDKLSRAVLDALTGIVWQDDSLIANKTVTKSYSLSPGVLVKISELPDMINEHPQS